MSVERVGSIRAIRAQGARRAVNSAAANEREGENSERERERAILRIIEMSVLKERNSVCLAAAANGVAAPPPDTPIGGRWRGAGGQRVGMETCQVSCRRQRSRPKPSIDYPKKHHKNPNKSGISGPL